MAKVNISNVEVLDAHASFQSLFRFKITFECYEALEEDLEWRLIYVSSAYNMALDQTLDSILVGPVPVGKHQFIFEAEPPNTDVIPVEDAVGVTVVIVACLYREQEFIRVGYYVNNEYADEQLRECPPERPQYERMQRHILADNPRVTRRGIDWGDSRSAAAAAAAADFVAAPAPMSPDGNSAGCGESSADPACGNSCQASQLSQLQQLQPSEPMEELPPAVQKSVSAVAADGTEDAAPLAASASTAAAKENCDPSASAVATAAAS